MTEALQYAALLGGALHVGEATLRDRLEREEARRARRIGRRAALDLAREEDLPSAARAEEAEHL